MLGMEIWDARTGRKVFSATSDVTLASEKIKEEPISMEEAFQKAWYGILKEIPEQSPVNPINTAGIDNEGSGSSEEDNRADSRNLANGRGTKAG
jgi:hypothetical protein